MHAGAELGKREVGKPEVGKSLVANYVVSVVLAKPAVAAAPKPAGAART
jgi:hypothetical protein